MACGVAVKRSLEFDQLHSPEVSAKRPKTAGAHLSPFGPAFAAAASSFQQSTRPTNAAGQSSFKPEHSANLSPGQLEAYLKAEIRYLKRRKLIPRRQQRAAGGESYRRAAAADSPPHQSSSDSEGEHSPPPMASVAAASSTAADDVEERPLFSLKQVQLICERLLQEQGSRLRHEYETVLNAKLAEQHEVFVTYTQDQIRRQIESRSDVPSYMS